MSDLCDSPTSCAGFCCGVLTSFQMQNNSCISDYEYNPLLSGIRLLLVCACVFVSLCVLLNEKRTLHVEIQIHVYVCMRI